MRKLKKILALSLILLTATSCVGRRLSYLEERKLGMEGVSAKSKEVDPDAISKLSLKEYLDWYKNLDAAPKLRLSPSQRPKKLTRAEMQEDFDFFFEELKENYPFFEVLKRKYGIDFLGSYDDYLKKIRGCNSDEEFKKAMEEIIGDLRNYHAQIRDKSYVEKTLHYFAHNWNQPSIYYEFLKLNQKVVRDRYGISGVQTESMTAKAFERSKSEDIEIIKGDRLSFEEKGEIAILSLDESLSSKVTDKDQEILSDFLKNKHMYKALVIDIRDNLGGDSKFWENYLIPKLITSPEQVTNHMFFKDSDRIRLMLSDDTLNVEKLSDIDITGIKLDHPEDLENFAYYIKDVISINPDITEKENGYEGKIYLLVDEDVFSAAEGLASFAKHTDFATVIGKQTGGDGITLGIINQTLPNSGLVFTYTNTLGYDPEGKINEENPTTPDIEVESLREAMKVIEEGK